jgi:hypothetical protein
MLDPTSVAAYCKDSTCWGSVRWRYRCAVRHRSELFDGFYKAGDSYYWTDPRSYYEQNWAVSGRLRMGICSRTSGRSCAPSYKDASRKVRTY